MAFPAVSAGAYGYPKSQAADVALQTVGDYLQTHPEIELVRFVLFGQHACQVFADALRRAKL